MRSMFTALNSTGIAKLIDNAQRRVCPVAPGIQVPAAQAVCRCLGRIDESATNEDWTQMQLRDFLSFCNASGVAFCPEGLVHGC